MEVKHAYITSIFIFKWLLLLFQHFCDDLRWDFVYFCIILRSCLFIDKQKHQKLMWPTV